MWHPETQGRQRLAVASNGRLWAALIDKALRPVEGSQSLLALNFMETIHDAIQALAREPSGVLMLHGPNNQPVGAFLSMPVVEEVARLQLKAGSVLRKRETRKQRKDRAALRKAEEKARRPRGFPYPEFTDSLVQLPGGQR